MIQKNYSYDVAVIGGGPSGLAAALPQLGTVQK